MGNPEKFSNMGYTRRSKQDKTQQDMCWTPLYVNNVNKQNNTKR